MRTIQGWDPLLIISQIISIQTIHYLVIALLLPPCLEAWTDKEALQYAGGARVTGYVLDWREMASRSTAPVLPRRPPPEKEKGGRRRPDRDRRDSGQPSRVVLKRSEHQDEILHLERDGDSHLIIAQSSPNITTTNQKNVTTRHLRPHHKRYTDHDPSHYAVTDGDETNYEVWDYGVSRTRGWIIAGVWMVVCLFDIIPLYYLVRKPTLILDFACTLTGLHALFTLYYTGFRFPTSVFWWAVMVLGTVLMIVGAEQLCVRREMKEGLGNVEDPDLEQLVEAESYELDER